MDNKDIYIHKDSVVMAFLKMGLAIVYLGSLNPWFMWSIGALYPIPAAICVFMALLISHSMKNPIFNNDFWIAPLIAFIIISTYMNVVRDINVNGYIAILFNAIVYLAVFRLNPSKLTELTAFLAKLMAWILVFSIPFYILYLIGFSLPGRDAVFGDNLYSYTNYYFFMVDDRSMFEIVPRFHSVFLEPGHLGTATVLLLMTQCGKWNKWYNIVLLIATLMTFSLAAYVFLVVLVFLHLWIKRKNLIGKLIAIILLVSSIVVGSFYYNNGDNLINNLILMRLEMVDGEMVGNNRVSEDFDREFDNFIDSDDIFLGRTMDRSSAGNSGYKVFFYEYGLIGMILCLAFYIISMVKYVDLRIWISVMILATLAFIVRGYPLWYNYFIPFYCFALSDEIFIKKNKTF